MQWASPMASLFRATIFAIGHRLHSASAFKRRTCPIFQFLCCLSHFPHFCKVSSTSFLHRFKNSSGRCWTLLQCFLQYRSGEVWMNFWMNFWLPQTSTSRICKDPSDKLLPWVFSKEFKIALALRIWHSQTPPMLLDSGGFLFYIIHSPPFSFKKLPNLIWSNSWNVWVSSVDAPTRFEHYCQI